MAKTNPKNEKKTEIKNETKNEINWCIVEVINNNTFISWKLFNKWDKIKVQNLQWLEHFVKII